VKYFRILRFRTVIEIYNKMSEIPNFLLLALISQMPLYLIFILVSKSTHPVNIMLSSQNAQYFHLSTPLIPDKRIPNRRIPDKRIPNRRIPDKRIPNTQTLDKRIMDTG
jgi:hypothetical protein